MSLYADYLKDSGLRHIIETDAGFITYEIHGNVCYAVDMYIKPEFRRQGTARQLMNQVVDLALNNNCKWVSTTINTLIKDPTRSMQGLITYGFKITRSEANCIYLVKEL